VGKRAKGESAEGRRKKRMCKGIFVGSVKNDDGLARTLSKWGEDKKDSSEERVSSKGKGKGLQFSTISRNNKNL